jgi:hypothetical protein
VTRGVKQRGGGMTRGVKKGYDKWSKKGGGDKGSIKGGPSGKK